MMGKRILIVDDEFGLADIVAQVLRERGYDVTLAINGKLALAEVQKHTPDLILLDIMMPVLDGCATLRELRNMDGAADVPVIMMTALTEALPREDPVLYQDVLLKPFTYVALMAILDEYAPAIEPG